MQGVETDRDELTQLRAGSSVRQALQRSSRSLQLEQCDRGAWDDGVAALEGCARRLGRRRALDADPAATVEAAAAASQLLSCLSDSLRIHAASEHLSPPGTGCARRKSTRGSPRCTPAACSCYSASG